MPGTERMQRITIAGRTGQRVVDELGAAGRRSVGVVSGGARGATAPRRPPEAACAPRPPCRGVAARQAASSSSASMSTSARMRTARSTFAAVARIASTSPLTHPAT